MPTKLKFTESEEEEVSLIKCITDFYNTLSYIFALVKQTCNNAIVGGSRDGGVDVVPSISNKDINMVKSGDLGKQRKRDDILHSHNIVISKQQAIIDRQNSVSLEKVREEQKTLVDREKRKKGREEKKLVVS